MGLVKINQISPGMSLAEDLRDSRGRFLLPNGADLTERHIRVLKMWGVIEANIEGIAAEDVEDAAALEIDPALIEMAEKTVRGRFRYSNSDHPVTRELLRLATLQKAEEMRKQAEEDAEGGGGLEDDTDSDEMPAVEPDKIDFHKFIRRHILELPTLPMIFLKMNETIAKPNSSANDIAMVISKDTSLSARLLRIVNSSFYGFPSKIDSISRAVAIIGTRQLSTLASGVTIINMFRDIPSDIIDMQSFWRHSIACGVNARIIASYQGIQNTERLFLSGLLHDIGRLILYNYAPDHAVYALTKAKNTQGMLNEIEYEGLDFDHAQAGGLLLKRWKLPPLIEHAVQYHHTPLKSRDRLEPSIVHLADIMANAMEIGSSGEHFVPPLDSGAWECIGLSVNVLDVIIKQANRHIEEILGFFYSDEH
ncbi:MAG: HDOD domain-containing protein [Deltaproteobacteria bacterium]|nr:HDOD domain-containing protein [Deltaproteobacteria bacterium]